MFSFERLDVYQKARELVKDVYQLQKQFPVENQEVNRIGIFKHC